jgi:hypothetical protein
MLSKRCVSCCAHCGIYTHGVHSCHCWVETFQQKTEWTSQVAKVPRSHLNVLSQSSLQNLLARVVMLQPMGLLSPAWPHRICVNLRLSLTLATLPRSHLTSPSYGFSGVSRVAPHTALVAILCSVYHSRDPPDGVTWNTSHSPPS